MPELWRRQRSFRLVPGIWCLAGVLMAGACGSGGTGPTPIPTPSPTPTPTPAPDAVFIGAGDIADCDPLHSTNPAATATLLDGMDGTVYTTGDNAYPDGSASDFASCYEPTWGRHKARTRPVPGNHDYITAGGAAYFGYFGDAAGEPGRGYYSYTLGAWHIVALNSNIAIAAGSTEAAWLEDDLTANPSPCTLAYFHHPIFSSGPSHGDTKMLDVWRILYKYHTDIVLNGHDHLYERFAPQDPDGRLDAIHGIREFIVGTGGAPLYTVGSIRPNSEAQASVWGILRLRLHARTYDWDFVPVAGQTFRDSGVGGCVD